jgi:hypothetical protein
MVILIYVSYMFDKLLFGVKSNHVVMEQDFRHCTILSCCHVHSVMHAYRCEMSGGYLYFYKDWSWWWVHSPLIWAVRFDPIQWLLRIAVTGGPMRYPYPFSRGKISCFFILWSIRSSSLLHTTATPQSSYTGAAAVLRDGTDSPRPQTPKGFRAPGTIIHCFPAFWRVGRSRSMRQGPSNAQVVA